MCTHRIHRRTARRRQYGAPMSRVVRVMRLAPLLAVLLIPRPLAAQAATPHVALVLDEDTPRSRPLVEAFQEEFRAFFRPGEALLLPPVAGDGTTTGVRAVLRRALDDSSIAVVIALGPIGSHLLARSADLPRPAIAAVVVDAAWQGIPLRDGASGVRNLTWVDRSYSVGATLADFHELVPFERLAVVLDSSVVRAIPGLEPGVAELVRGVGAEASIVRAGASADGVLAALPVAGVDAVYLTPIGAMSEAELARLLDGLATRRIPTVSYAIHPEVPVGALASYEPPENWPRLARRVAVNVQRILAGEDAGTLPVQLVGAPRLTLNLATARRIGFSAGWDLLTEAELLNADSAGPRDTLTLAGAMRGAAARNLDLAATRLDVAAREQNVRRARSGLLPRVESRIGGIFNREETAAASLGHEPERRIEGGLSMSIPLYSEEAWAAYGSEQQLQRAREARQEEVRMDVVADAAAAFLNVWRAQTVADIRKTNLYRTRSNLEVARVREAVGSTSRADLYRWEGEVANARRDLVAADAQVRVASIELRRLLDRPLGTPLAQQPAGVADSALLGRDSSVLRRLETPAGLQALTDVLTTEAIRFSPEVATVDAEIAAQRRRHTSAGRAFWLPTFSLEAGLSEVLDRGGAGSAAPTLPDPLDVPGAPDMSWQVRLEASLPIFTGSSRSATRAQTAIDLQRLEVRRDAARLAVEQRVRSALELAASSYVAIALTRDAALAAGRNYELVSDAYARGTASITALIDAQSAALTADEAAANAVNDFLVDLVRVERAMGTYTVFQTPEQRQSFLDRIATLEEAP